MRQARDCDRVASRDGRWTQKRMPTGPRARAPAPRRVRPVRRGDGRVTLSSQSGRVACDVRAARGCVWVAGGRGERARASRHVQVYFVGLNQHIFTITTHDSRQTTHTQRPACHLSGHLRAGAGGRRDRQQTTNTSHYTCTNFA